MDKTILSVGITLLGLDAVFLIPDSFGYELSTAYSTGGLLWLVIGSITSILGMSQTPSEAKTRCIEVLT